LGHPQAPSLESAALEASIRKNNGVFMRRYCR